MGGVCASGVVVHELPPHGYNNGVRYGSGVETFQGSSKMLSNFTPVMTRDDMEKNLQKPKQPVEPILVDDTVKPGNGSNKDDFYDGIPRYQGDLSIQSRSGRSKHMAVAKVSEVGLRLSRVGTVGLGKAVDVLDTLGSSVTNLNAKSVFASGAVTRGSELRILAFEVANTIVKGSNLMNSLSKRKIVHLREDVLPSKGVQNLVSTNMDELTRIIASDKREEFKVFTSEVVRFGNSCKHSQWHNLDRYFEKIGRELILQKHLRDEAEFVKNEMMILVQYTAELYHELNALNKYESDFQKGDNIMIFRAEVKSQRKQVKALKKKSLWSRSLEEVMEKIVVIVHFLHLEIHSIFGSADDDKSMNGYLSNDVRLGPAGLALHYANIVIQIDNFVARSSSIPPNSRDTLYQSLPPDIKSALRSKLQPFCVKEELTVNQIKAEMEKTLHWLVPIAANTAKAHHGFGWVGEWANTGPDKKTSGQANNVMRIETLHHAKKETTETYILELVLWLHQLVNQVKANTNGGNFKLLSKFSSTQSPPQTNPQSKTEATEKTEIPIDVKWKNRSTDNRKNPENQNKSCHNSPTKMTNDTERLPSGILDSFLSLSGHII